MAKQEKVESAFPLFWLFGTIEGMRLPKHCSSFSLEAAPPWWIITWPGTQVPSLLLLPSETGCFQRIWIYAISDVNAYLHFLGSYLRMCFHKAKEHNSHYSCSQKPLFSSFAHIGRIVLICPLEVWINTWLALASDMYLEVTCVGFLEPVHN